MSQKYRKRFAMTAAIEGYPVPEPSKELAACTRCHVDFPAHLINPMASCTEEGHLSYQNVCPICALKMANDDLGLQRTTFDGPVAESLRLEAVAWLAKG